MSTASYCPNTPEEIRAMLDAIGVASVEELFRPIQPALRAKSFDLPAGMSEFEMLHKFQTMAGNNAQHLVHFVGGGFYDHLIPSVVDHLAGRAEFYTAYTPYQPECSQGTLQALFEYQTAICRLTGLAASNASLYDGGTALAEAALMALRITGRSRLVIDGSVNPFSREIVRTYLASLDIELVEIEPKVGMEDDIRLRAAVDDATAAVIVQNPNFFGCIEDLAGAAQAAHDAGAVAVASVNPLSLALLKPPGECGGDIAVGEAQPLGLEMSFGGPGCGFISARQEFIRRMPGRIAGQTLDAEGRRGFVLTLQTREQHIRREKASSNICTNQTLMALRAAIYLSALGPGGLRRAAELCVRRAHELAARLARVPRVKVPFPGPFFHEFVAEVPHADRVSELLLEKGFLAGLGLQPCYAGLRNHLLLCCTERHSPADLEAFAVALEECVKRAVA